MGCGTDLVSSLAVLFCSLRVVCDGQSTGPPLSDLVGKCLLDESPRNSNSLSFVFCFDFYVAMLLCSGRCVALADVSHFRNCGVNTGVREDC